MSERVEVFPRYTGGSPAPLYREYAIRIGEQEREAYAAHLEGVYGERLREFAKRSGLEGIIVKRGKRGFSDLLTGRAYGEMPYDALRYSDCVTVVEKKKGVVAYFRRQVLADVKVGDGMLESMKRLGQVLGVEWDDEQVMELWNTRKIVRS